MKIRRAKYLFTEINLHISGLGHFKPMLFFMSFWRSYLGSFRDSTRMIKWTHLLKPNELHCPISALHELCKSRFNFSWPQKWITSNNFPFVILPTVVIFLTLVILFLYLVCSWLISLSPSLLTMIAKLIEWCNHQVHGAGETMENMTCWSTFLSVLFCLPISELKSSRKISHTSWKEEQPLEIWISKYLCFIC